MRITYIVIAEWDASARVWVVRASEIPGLNVEADTLAGFKAIVRSVADELILANVPGCGPGPFQVEIEAAADGLAGGPLAP
jgi:hypothetical protein